MSCLQDLLIVSVSVMEEFLFQKDTFSSCTETCFKSLISPSESSVSRQVLVSCPPAGVQPKQKCAPVASNQSSSTDVKLTSSCMSMSLPDRSHAIVSNAACLLWYMLTRLDYWSCTIQRQDCDLSVPLVNKLEPISIQCMPSTGQTLLTVVHHPFASEIWLIWNVCSLALHLPNGCWYTLLHVCQRHMIQCSISWQRCLYDCYCSSTSVVPAIKCLHCDGSHLHNKKPE